MSFSGPHLMEEWLGSLLESAPAHLAAASGGESLALSPVLLGADSGERCTLLLYASGRTEPVLVVKTGRGEASGRALANEFDVLRALQRRLDPSTPRFFPQPAGFRECAGSSALALEAVPGETWFRRLRTPPGMGIASAAHLARRILDCLAAVGDLQAGVHGTGGSMESIRAQWGDCVSEIGDRLSARRPLADKEQDCLTTIRNKIGGVETTAFQHGDLFPKNVLLPTPGRVDSFALIDWADAGRHLPPLFDEVLLFSTLWRDRTGPLGEAERLAHFQRIFWEPIGLGPSAQEALRLGRERWRLGGAWTEAEVILLCLSVYARRIALNYGAGHPEHEILIRNIEYTLARMAGH